MRIGLDIDGVITNVGQFTVDYFTKFCVENDIKYSVGEIDYLLSNTFNVTQEQEKTFWNKYLKWYSENEKARPFASEIIRKLKNEGHEIYIITARWLTNRDDNIGEQMRNIVKDWLNKNDIVYDKLIFSKADNERKIKEITDNKIDIMVEDSPRNIIELSKIVPVICYNAEYNRNCNGNNITRCYSWYDIYRIINDNI